jgi:hypothetical protein
MNKRKIQMVLTFFLVFIFGCSSMNENESINELMIKKIAWDYLDDTQKGIIIGSESDIVYTKEPGSEVYLIENNAPEDVWKQAELGEESNGKIRVIFMSMLDITNPISVEVDIRKKRATESQ